MPDPCPNCGPLEAEVERLRLEVDRMTDSCSNHVVAANGAAERIRELEQALAEARAKSASDSNGFKLTLDAQIRPLYEKRRELTKALRLGGDAHQTIGEALAVVESAIDALEMVDAEVQRRHVDPEFYSAPLPAPPEGER